MEDDSDEADDIPTIKVGGEEYEITDVTHEIIARYNCILLFLFPSMKNMSKVKMKRELLRT